MSKKVALKRRKTIARTPTKTKEACPVRNDGNDDILVYNFVFDDEKARSFKIFNYLARNYLS
jgi:hypothetical protein